MIHVETAAATVVPAGEEAAMVATARNHAAEDTLAVALALAEGNLDAEDHAADLTLGVPPEGAQDQKAARNPRNAKSHARSHARRSARRAIPLRLSFVTIQDQDLAVLVATAVTEEEAAVDLAATLAAPAVTMLTMVVTMTVDMDTATSEQTSANFVEV